MITLFHIGPKGFNIGNHAIRVGMQVLLQEALGQVVNVVSLPATSRYETHQRAGLTAKTIHEINQYGHGVIVGGGNLYENGELEIDVDALGALEVPLMLFSLSWGRVYNRCGQLVRRTDAMPDRVIAALNARADYSLARDTATLTHLRGLGAERAVLGGCPTIFLDRIGDRLPPLAPGDRDLALVSVRNPTLMNVPLSVQSRVPADVRAIVRLLRQAGYERIRLLCHDHRDIPFAASFDEVEWMYTDDVATFLALLRGCAVNVTYRLHSALPCLAFDRPFVKLSYDERSLSLMDTVGLADWNIDLLQMQDVVATVGARHRDLDALSAIRTAATPHWTALHETMSGSLKEFAADVDAHHRDVVGGPSIPPAGRSTSGSEATGGRP